LSLGFLFLFFLLIYAYNVWVISPPTPPVVTVITAQPPILTAPMLGPM
jgi:hypothetical protein